jgi:hydrogenase nickel incorporation protein HypB
LTPQPKLESVQWIKSSQIRDQNRKNEGKTIQLEHEILSKNNLAAEKNRKWLRDRKILSLNLMSSPGSGKTTLLERTIQDLQGRFPIRVLEGDQETTHDAERIRKAGCDVVQINTGAGCHLDAEMVARGIQELAPQPNSVLMIENVGNLVCPALFDLGESRKVVICSITEGEDKPLKYPHMYRAATVMVINKIDLLRHVTFDLDKCVAFAKQINPKIQVIQTSATRGDGLKNWYDWLEAEYYEATTHQM